MQVSGEKAKRQNTSESEPCAVGVVEDVEMRINCTINKNGEKEDILNDN